MRGLRVLLVLCFVIIGLSTVPHFVFSTENESAGGNKEEIDALNQEILKKKEKIKELEETIQAYKKKIQQQRLESVSLSNQISILDNRMVQIELDIEATEQKLATTELEIERLELAILDKIQVIERQNTILAEFIRTLHYENDKKYIEILAAYESFSDFYSRVLYLETIEQDLGAQTKLLKIARMELEEKKLETENKQQIFAALQDELKQKQEDVKEQTYAKTAVLAQSQQSELQYQTLVNNLRSQYQQIENEISGIEQEVRRKLSKTDAFNQVTDDSAVLSWPTQSRYITAYFHDPSYPYRQIFEHGAIDIRAGQGTPVKAAASGYIGRAKTCTTASCYAYVMIVHGDGISTVYGHLSKIAVQEDQFVTRGDVVGYSGAAPGTIGAGPFTTGPHLHFEVRKSGIPVNPLGYLVKDY